MTKVGELRQQLVTGFGQAPPCVPRPLYLTVATNMVIEAVDSLISAAHAEGVAEGAENAKKEEEAQKIAIYKAFPHLSQWTEVERLRDKMFAGHTALVNVDALCAAVAEQERERIRGESQMVGVDEDCIKFIGSVDNYVGAAFLVPVDVMDPPVLAPTKEPDRGNI